MGEHDISFGPGNKYCGPCHVTVDRSKEKTANAILISNGPLLNFQKQGRYNGMDQYREEGFTQALPDLKNRNLDQFWVFQMKESGIKGKTNKVN